MLLAFLVSTNLAWSKPKIEIQSQPKPETVLTQTVGTAAFQVVTSREVKAVEMITQALEKEFHEPSVQLSPNNVSRLLFEIAVYRESQNLGAIKVDSGELSKRVNMVKARLEKNSDWKKLEVTDAELRNWIERKKIAMDFLKLKASSLTTIVTDQEIQDYYEKNRAKFGSTPLADQQNNIRLFLQRENQKQRVQEWLTALKTKYQIRNDLVETSTAKTAIEKNTESPHTETIEIPRDSKTQHP